MIRVIETDLRTLISIAEIERIDKSNVSEFGKMIKGHIKENAEIIINFNKVFYIDTEGFKMLLSIKRGLEKHGGRLKLMQLSGNLSDLFKLMGLSEKFEWVSSEQLTDPAFAS